MVSESAIRNREHKSQIVDFGGLRWGKIMPTDLDAYIDFGGKLFIFIEAKYGSGRMSFGQRLALQNLCDALHQPQSGINAVALVCTHKDKEDIDLAEAKVTEYRWEKTWRVPLEQGHSIKTAIDSIKTFVEGRASVVSHNEEIN